KAVALAELARALRDWPGTVVSVQREAEPAELADLSARIGRTVADFGDVNDDLDLAAALFARIGEYVGVSNTNMYIAAGVGLAARVLVKRPLEWRWCGDAADRSRWFPTFTCYHEDPAQGWGPALRRLRQDLGAGT
ncbi:MAG: hypothetical protein ACU85V_18635, partial [Gammaproteobacteria bacterium]